MYRLMKTALIALISVICSAYAAVDWGSSLTKALSEATNQHELEPVADGVKMVAACELKQNGKGYFDRDLGR